MVIDADVARSAGETKHPVSRSCRQFLDAVTEYRHRVVMTPQIQQEWCEHASRYTYRWLRRMNAKRPVHRCTVAGNDPIRQRVAAVLPDAGNLHLLEAAIATDRLVASQDERAHAAFRRVSGKIREIQGVVWFIPHTRKKRRSTGAVAERSRKRVGSWARNAQMVLRYPPKPGTSPAATATGAANRTARSATGSESNLGCPPPACSCWPGASPPAPPCAPSAWTWGRHRFTTGGLQLLFRAMLGRRCLLGWPCRCSRFLLCAAAFPPPAGGACTPSASG